MFPMDSSSFISIYSYNLEVCCAVALQEVMACMKPNNKIHIYGPNILSSWEEALWSCPSMSHSTYYVLLCNMKDKVEDIIIIIIFIY